VVIASYNQHIGSFSPEPFGWFAPPSLLGAREPTLPWNQFGRMTLATQTRWGRCAGCDQECQWHRHGLWRPSIGYYGASQCYWQAK